jgi:acetate---CoA ligase (ADP-forming)
MSWDLNPLLRPRSIAIVGASPTPGALSACVLNNLERAGYAGPIHPVNPKHETIAGRRCVPSVDELPVGVDCAVLAIPRAGVLEALEACARRRVGAAIVFSAGFAESGDRGREEQAEIGRIARESGMVVEGPNCLGLVNHVDATPLTFVLVRTEAPDPGRGIGLVSQSGAVAAVLGVSLRHRGLKCSYSVSTGNEAACGVEDFVEFLIDDAQTSVIVLVVEQFRQPKRLLDLLASAQDAGKRVVLLHPGSSSAGRASAATHTGAMTADYDVMRVKVERAGALVADTLEELVDVAEIAVRCRTLPSGGAAVFAESGLFKALSLDVCERLGLPLPALTEAGAQALRRVLPPFIPPANPLDVTAQGLVDPDLYKRALPPFLAEAQYGSIVLAIILTDEETSRLKLGPIVSAIEEIRPEKPVLFACMDEGAEVAAGYFDRLRDLGVPVFPSAERALRALARLSARGAGAGVLGEGGRAGRAATGWKPVLLEVGVIPEYRAKALLAKAGIPIPAGGLAVTVDEALAIAGRVGYPVALKAQATALPHKTDAGGVALDLKDASALTSAWHAMHAAVYSAKPGLILDGLLVEAMGGRGVELIVGARNDSDWGPVLLVGFGGVLAEAFHDVRLLAPDASRAEIVEALLRMKSGALLRGLRGSPPMDVEAAADAVARLGTLVLAAPAIREIEINPLVVYPKGQGAVALDALIHAG